MSRERLQNRRASTTFEFQHAGLAYTCSYSCFGDGRPGEVFLQNHKGGSGADVAARESAIAASLALQHGCSIQVLQRALLRNPNGEVAGALGRAIDLIVEGGPS
jgi:hypothetical protein